MANYILWPLYLQILKKKIVTATEQMQGPFLSTLASPDLFIISFASLSPYPLQDKAERPDPLYSNIKHKDQN